MQKSLKNQVVIQKNKIKNIKKIIDKFKNV
jgi:hypothetical protein